MPLANGETFAGYRIIRLLGSGGMGEVYLAQHPRLPRRDALKLLPPDWSADPEYRARFNREADLASTLWHPHIVGVHDRGEEDGQLWISMDFVDGLDAARLLADRYPAGMPVEEVARIVTAVASALDYAHKQGLLHRDVKPSNIMLTHVDDDGEQRILLTDFGIARDINEISGLTVTNMAVGTVAYSAPEQLLGEEVDGRTDQYSLAATAYHLLTGSFLFPHSNPNVVSNRHINYPPPPLSKARPSLAKLDPVLAIALAKRPEDRFTRCSDFARAIVDESTAARTADGSSAAPTRRAPASRRKSPSARSTRFQTGLLVASVVAVLAIAAGSLVTYQLTRGRSDTVRAPRTSTIESTPPPATTPLPPPTSKTTSATTPAAVLPAYPPPNSGCTGTVTGHYDFKHPQLGPMRIFLLIGENKFRMDAGCVAAVMPSGAALPATPLDAGLGLEFANPATDATGGLFIKFRSMSAHAPSQVLVLVPNAYGFRKVAQEIIDVELVGPGADGNYELRHRMNDCTPSCAEGTWTEEILRWNGSDYVA